MVKYFVIVILLSCIHITKDSMKTLKFSQEEVTLNYVPNEETAIKVGEAILLPIYKQDVKKYKYKAVLLDSNIWFVYGTLNGKDLLGGVPCVKLQKSDCKVLAVDYGK
jgi:NTF2 fold immunity protein